MKTSKSPLYGEVKISANDENGKEAARALISVEQWQSLNTLIAERNRRLPGLPPTTCSGFLLEAVTGELYRMDKWSSSSKSPNPLLELEMSINRAVALIQLLQEHCSQLSERFEDCHNQAVNCGVMDFCDTISLELRRSYVHAHNYAVGRDAIKYREKAD